MTDQTEGEVLKLLRLLDERTSRMAEDLRDLKLHAERLTGPVATEQRTAKSRLDELMDEFKRLSPEARQRSIDAANAYLAARGGQL